MPEIALYLTVRQVLAMLMTAVDKYGLARGWVKERLYIPTRERGRHEGETTYSQDITQDIIE